MRDNDTWACYARPVKFHGLRCGHRNPADAPHCGVCGSTWKASEDQRAKETSNQKGGTFGSSMP